MYDNHQGKVLAECCTVKECAEAMGIKPHSMYQVLYRAEFVKNPKYTITKHDIKEPRQRSCSYVYTIYDNRTDTPIIVDGEAEACIEALGISSKTFRSLVCRSLAGINKRWTVIKTRKDELDYDLRDL